MAEIIWRQKAIESRVEILRYGKYVFGEKAAKKLNDRIEECTARLRRFPASGFIDPLLTGRPIQYRSIMLNKRFKLIYFSAFIEGVEYVEIVDIWDTLLNPDILKEKISDK